MAQTISVIVPVYNKADSLEACIDSIFPQLSDYDELIAVDDGSTDSSIDVLQQYASDPRLRIIRQENAGVSAARNTGTAHANGDYVLFVDADDTLEPDAVPVFRDAADLETSDLICGCAYVCKEDGSKEVLETMKEEVLKDEGFLEACLLDRTISHHVWANAYRRSFLVRNGIVFDKNLSTHEDWNFNFQCALKKPECHIIPDFVYDHYENRNGISQSKVTDKKIEDILSVAEGAKKAVEEQYPGLSALAENTALKSHLAILAICPPPEAAEQSIKYVKDRSQYFVPNSRMDRILFFLVTHHLYWAYRIAYRVKFH